MGRTTSAHAVVLDVVARENHRAADAAEAGEQDVDDVRMLLRELRLRRQLREQG